jgi:hypothetical protein
MTDLKDLRERVEKVEGPLGNAWRKHVVCADDGCWLWTGSGADHQGRGRVWIGGRLVLMHRAVWQHLHGPIPADMYLCHHCDTPACVRPDHLYVGTPKDNVRDMLNRKRHGAHRNPQKYADVGRSLGSSNNWMRNESNPKAKLTEAQVASIRNDRRKTKILAAEYGVDRTTIQKIRRGAAWSLSALENTNV